MALDPLINSASQKEEQAEIEELSKKIFCTIQVQKSTWDGQPVYIVLIEDVTDDTQTKLAKAHEKEIRK